MTDYFSKQAPDDVVSADYEELASINTKTPGQEAQAFVNLQKAFEKDTVVDNKVKYISRAAALSKKMGDRKQEAYWLGIAYNLKPNPSQTDLYNWGYAHYQAGNFTTSDSIFCNLYQGKYPDQIYGYLWCARSIQAEDTTMQNPRFAPAQEKLAEMAIKLDSVKFKKQAIDALALLTSYYNDVKKDSKAALTYVDRILAIDPTNAFGLQVKPILQKQASRPAGNPAPRPRTSGSTTTKSSTSAAEAKKK
jgi:tetratricopeptide (TPR) repeat protein